MRSRPTYTVIAGPDGAGKSTLVEKLEKQGQGFGPFINPDIIARSITDKEGIARDFTAGRKTLEQTRMFIVAKTEFCRETTLSSNEILRSIKKAKAEGFAVHMEYVGIKSLRYAKARVAERAAKGGHDIPQEAQNRRYHISLTNAAKAALVVDRAVFRDNSNIEGHRKIAVVERGHVVWLASEPPKWLEAALKDIPRALPTTDISKHENSEPALYMIAGPNGAGKSTLFATRLKPHVSAPFINADLIQKTEMTDQTAQGSYEAARLAERRRQDAIGHEQSFVTESVFSHPSKNELLSQAKAAGFKVYVFHVNVRNADLSVARVASRVKSGGHNVPEHKIRERYLRNQALIRKAVLSADKAYVYDNSIRGQAPKAVITFENGRAVKASQNMPKWARDLYKDELRSFSPARLNKAAASFREIGDIAKAQVHELAKVLIPTGNKVYSGQIVGESDLHILQQTRDGKLYGHFKTALEKNYALGKSVSIAYISRSKAHVEKMKPIEIRDISIGRLKTILLENEKPARETFEADLVFASKAQDGFTAKRSEALLNSLKLAPAMLDKLKLGGVKALKVESNVDDSSALKIRAILKSASREYNNRGLGQVKAPKSVGRDR